MWEKAGGEPNKPRVILSQPWSLEVDTGFAALKQGAAVAQEQPGTILERWQTSEKRPEVTPSHTICAMVFGSRLGG